MAANYKAMVEAIKRSNSGLSAQQLKALCLKSSPHPKGVRFERWKKVVNDAFPRAKTKQPAEAERCPLTQDLFEVTP